MDIISAQLCSCAREIFAWVALFWSALSLLLIIVDNSPNMHNTGFFPDCYLFSVTNGSIWIPHLARHLEIFKKPNFQVVKFKSTFIWKILSQAELETEGLCLATIFGSPLTSWLKGLSSCQQRKKERKKERKKPKKERKKERQIRFLEINCWDCQCRVNPRIHASPPTL